MIKQSILNKLDKNKVYCNMCLHQDIISELQFDKDLNRFERCKIHNGRTQYFNIRFNNKLDKWCLYKGLGKEAIFSNIIETDLDIQIANLNTTKFIYIDIQKLDSSIKIVKSETGDFFVSKYLNEIEYIHSNKSDKFISYRVDLFGICSFKECNQKFKFSRLRYNLTKSGEHFCCIDHQMTHRNRSDKMRKISSENAIKLNEKIWKDPEFIKRKSEIRKALNIERFKDPNEIEKQSQVMKNNWSKEEFRKGHSQRLKERNLKNWQNEEYVKKMQPYLLHGGKCNFLIKDDILYYCDRTIDDYIPWEEYKNKFLNSEIQNIGFKNSQLPDGFQLIQTFRVQDSEDWSSARCAFEQHLIDLEIGWFVYIKFFIDEVDNIKPLVVGKSGSLLVNGSGSDISFSTDINDGPARRFLYESNLEWCKTQIAIYKCNSEQEAFRFEKEIALKYNLFES